MTTLASYVFPAGTNLSGVVVRGFATGRYLNNTGSNQTVTLTATQNATTLITQTIVVPTSTAAQAWFVHVHFYFQQAIVVAGNRLSIGCSLQAGIGNAVTAGGLYTSSYLAAAPLQVYAVPNATYIDPSQAQTLTFAFTPANVANETLETGCAYLEAL